MRVGVGANIRENKYVLSLRVGLGEILEKTYLFSLIFPPHEGEGGAGQKYYRKLRVGVEGNIRENRYVFFLRVGVGEIL
jgi:hypothetical protein